MANIKLTGQDELSAIPASGDWFYVVDVSDTTDGADGSSKKVSYANVVQTATSLYLNARKDSAGTITKGLPIYITGYNPSGYVTVEQADANDAAKMPAVGLAGEDVTNTATSSVVIVGLLTAMDTSGYSVGDSLYVQDDGTLGTARPSTADDLVQKVGTVIRSDASAGVINVVGAFRTNDIPNTLLDTVVRIVDEGDTSKVAMFQASGITTATTRTFTFPDESGILITDQDSASDSASGLVELATAAETTTGTDTGRAVTPDGLAGSSFGTRIVSLKIIDDATELTTGDGKLHYFVPSELNGMDIVGVSAGVSTVSSSGTPEVQIYNVTDSVDVLSTTLTIDANEKHSSTATAAAVINTSNDSVATGDELRIDVDTAGTGAKGLQVDIKFRLP